MSFITSPIAWATGIPESTLRLLMTVGLAYPVARTYNNMYVHGNGTKDPVTPMMIRERNMFIVLSGLALALFFSGTDIYHSLLTISVSYGILYFSDLKNDRRLGTIGVWIFNTVYLLGSYYFTATDEYDVSWTMIQCILCLRLMGFSFDFYDGTQPEEESSKKPHSFASDTPLKTLPEFIEVLGYCYFPSSFLIGPQFSFSLYRRWLASSPNDRKTSALDPEEYEKSQQRYVLRCVGLAVLYLGLQQVIGSQYPTSYLLTDEFASLSYFRRLVIFFISGKFVYSKYVGVWLLTEGASAYFGISYEGDDKEGFAQFGGLANTHPALFETATSIDHVIASFNINTNLWVKYYVFKRLRFLGNKYISQVASLAFLALWHGFHANYFITFVMEFVYVEGERVLRKHLLPVVQTYTKKNVFALYAWKAVAWLTCAATCNYAVVGFDLLKFGKAWTAYKNVWFIGHIAIILLLAANKFLLKSPVRVTKKSL